jgi:hypothetical protein
VIHRETEAEYQARQAISASFCWDLLTECPAQAWHNSVFNPERPPEEPNGDLDFGKLVHLATLENHLLAERVMIVDAGDFRKKEARHLRDEAYVQNKIPLLFSSARKRNSTRYGYEDLQTIRAALEQSAAAELLFGPGESEVSFTWDFVTPGDLGPAEQGPFGPTRYHTPYKIACKARADRKVPGALVDLKTADSASPAAFSRAMARYGHHLRAAFYVDGWASSLIDEGWNVREYLFVVVGKSEPHLVQTYRLDDHALEAGRRLYRKAFSEIRRARETGVWSGYGGEGKESIITMPLPTRVDYQLADMEARGEL